jgi:hypothetical protein
MLRTHGITSRSGRTAANGGKTWRSRRPRRLPGVRGRLAVPEPGASDSRGGCSSLRMPVFGRCGLMLTLSDGGTRTAGAPTSTLRGATSATGARRRGPRERAVRADPSRRPRSTFAARRGSSRRATGRVTRALLPPVDCSVGCSNRRLQVRQCQLGAEERLQHLQEPQARHVWPGTSSRGMLLDRPHARELMAVTCRTRSATELAVGSTSGRSGEETAAVSISPA